MDRALAAIWRYRWELTPVVTIALARLPASLVGNRWELDLVAVVILAVALPSVRRQGRPLLMALWLLLLLTALFSTIMTLALHTLTSRWDLSTTPVSLSLTLFFIVAQAITLAVAVSQTPRGMRFAMLVGAAHLAPTNFLGFISFVVAMFGVGWPSDFPRPLLRWTPEVGQVVKRECRPLD